MNTQEQLIEYVIQDIISFFMEDNNCEWDEAMLKFYLSETFEKLQDTETGLYRESPAYVYDIFCDELKYGKIVQNEI